MSFGRICCLNTLNFFSGATLPFPANNPTNSATPGFYSGNFSDKSLLYPGTGLILGQRRVARILTTTTIAPNGVYCLPGAYSAYLITELYDGTNATFFYAHPQLKWVPTNLANINSVTGKIGVVTFDTQAQKHFVLRMNLTSYQAIGALLVDSTGAFIQSAFYYDPVALNLVYTQGPFEVLACQ